MGKLREFLENSGLDATDIPKAFVIHELLGIGFAAAAWTVRSIRHNYRSTDVKIAYATVLLVAGDVNHRLSPLRWAPPSDA